MAVRAATARWRMVLAALGVCLLARGGPGLAASPEETARQILEATGVKGGLVVHLGCGDGRLTAALRANGSYLVHGLDAAAATVEAARKHIRSLDLYGEVSVGRWTGANLPYADNLVNLVVAEDLGKAPVAEVIRVLCPGGVAYVKQNGQWSKRVKPRPANIDEWTHALHDADNNAVADDTVVGPPRHMQWVGSPKWARSHDHLSSVSVAVVSGGRLFYIADEGPTLTVALPAAWRLVARDAFSGVVLWKRPIELWEGHLRDFRSGPSTLPRRLVAVGERVYVTLGYGEPVSALDAATGETLRDYSGTEGTEEILYSDGVLYLAIGDPKAQREAAAVRRRVGNVTYPARRLLALRADTGQELWRKADDETADLMPLALAVARGRVYFQNTRELVCLDAKSGQRLWHAARPVSLKRPAWSAPTLVVYRDVVLSADRAAPAQVEGDATKPRTVQWLISRGGGNSPVGDLIAFSADTGKELWRSPAREAYNAPVDVLVADGLVWTGILVRAGEPGITAGRNPRTGDVERRREPDKAYFSVGMGHHRCHRNRATERYLVLGRAGIEFIDLATGQGIANHWVRGACQYGVVPCNGLIYAPSHSCACYIEAKLSGFNCLAPKREPKKVADGARLERGPAFGQVGPGRPAPGGDGAWPTLRYDAARSGATAAAVPAELKPTWRADLGGRLSSLVAADGKVLVASIDTHTIHALDARTGEPAWSFTAGGRVDSPPTMHRGLALFGCTDGWVYAVRAADGVLAWRFRAAPEERRVFAYGQLESAWPIHGSVLVQDDVVHCVAGRSTFLDGGLRLCRLDAATGKPLSETPVTGRDPETGFEPGFLARGTGMPGELPDVLASDGTSVFMRHARFDKLGVEQAPDVPHLFCSVGFLDGSWWHRTYWMYGTRMGVGYGGWPRVGNQVPSGRLLVCHGTDVYGFGRNQYASHGSHVGLGQTHYRLFGASKEPERIPPQQAKAGAKKERRRPGPRTRVNYRWSVRVPILARGMVLADTTLFVAGPPDALDRPEEGLAALEGKRGALLLAVSAADGKEMARLKLDASPVFDGLIAADGCLYLATTDGRVVCLAKP